MLKIIWNVIFLGVCLKIRYSQNKTYWERVSQKTYNTSLKQNCDVKKKRQHPCEFINPQATKNIRVLETSQPPPKSHSCIKNTWSTSRYYQYMLSIGNQQCISSQEKDTKISPYRYKSHKINFEKKKNLGTGKKKNYWAGFHLWWIAASSLQCILLFVIHKMLSTTPGFPYFRYETARR